METITRTPRPKGLTELGIDYNKGIIDKEELDRHLIRHYVGTSFKVCNKAMALDDFIMVYDIDQQQLDMEMLGIGKDLMGKVEDNALEDQFRAVFGVALKSSLADRNTALMQYNRMLASQGNGYKAFISGETNKALKLTLESTKNIMDLAKSLSSTPGLNLTVNQNATEVTNNNYLTVDKALTVLNSKKASEHSIPLLEDPEAKEALYHKHGLADLPVVQANKQSGLDTRKEGLDFNNIASLSDKLLTDEDKENLKQDHQDRRADQLDIDQDQDEMP